MVARRIVLRIIIVLAWALAAIAIVLGFFPGAEVFERGVYVDTVTVGGRANWAAGYVLLLVLPGVFLWRRPQLAYGLLWSLWTIGVTVLLLVATFDLSSGDRMHVPLPALRAFALTMKGLLGLLILALPVASALVWWLTRERPEPPVSLPRARVVSR